MEKAKLFFIYCIENIITGRIYIGKSYTAKGRSAKARWGMHISTMRRGPSDPDYSYIHRGVNKHGIDKFNYFIMQYMSSEEEAYLAENDLINYCKEQGVKLYNVIFSLTRNVFKKRDLPMPSNWRTPTTKEIREKQSISHSKNKLEHKHTEEIVNIIKEARKGQDMTFRISKEIKEEVIRLFDNGVLTKQAISEKLNIKFDTVRTIIKRKDKVLQRQFISDEKKIEIIIFTRNNKGSMKMQEIADKFNISKGLLEGIMYNQAKKLIK